MTLTIPSWVLIAVVAVNAWFVVGTLVSRYVWMPLALRIWGRNPNGGAPWPWVFNVAYGIAGPIMWAVAAFDAVETRHARRRRQTDG